MNNRVKLTYRPTGSKKGGFADQIEVADRTTLDQFFEKKSGFFALFGVS
jgi:hypothetical protein